MAMTTDEVNVSLFDEVKRLRKENAELAAQVERLRATLQRVVDYTAHLDCYSDAITTEIIARLEETPAQSLANVRADAVESFGKMLITEAKELPVQHEQETKGCSTYNWQTYYAQAAIKHAQAIREGEL